MTFKISERSEIEVKKNGYPSEKHNQLSDAMEVAVNWLADRPVGETVIIIETTTVKKTSS